MAKKKKVHIQLEKRQQVSGGKKKKAFA